MPQYLLDTNVVSMLAPTRKRTESDEKLVTWIEECGDDLRLSVVTAAEVRDGIEKARRTGATKKAQILEEWWGEILHYWPARIFPVDLAVAAETGRLLDVARAAGETPAFEDVTIAATASVHDLIILTRNVKHFRSFGLPIIDPFERIPSS